MGIARVHVAGWEENYRNILDEEAFESRTLAKRIAQWSTVLPQSQNRTFVACDEGGAIAGFAKAEVLDPPYQGFETYLGGLYLHSSAKGSGTGRALLCAVAADLVKSGFKNMALRVLRLNPARGFYEHLGARLLPPEFNLEAEAFDDVAYAFDDLSRLARWPGE